MTAIPLRLRPATLDDIEAIVRIERESFSDPWSARSFRDLVVQRNVVCAVAERDIVAEAGDSAREIGVDSAGTQRAGGRSVESIAAEIVGFAVVYLAGSEGDLANLATAASARRSGVGRRLLEHVLAEAKGRGACMIFLEVRESNRAARELYASAGFVDVGRRTKYYARPVEDALVLRKELS